MPNKNVINLKNSNLDQLENDYLYHININVTNTKNPSEIQERFGDAKVICMGGTKSRMRKLAQLLREVLEPNNNGELIDLCESTDRYAMFKIGPVLCCSHGIGMASFSILLHELFKLVKYAKCDDPVFIRVGTCGGLGLEPGTVVVTKDAFNGFLRNEYELGILGERVVRPAKFSESIAKDILSCSESQDAFQIIMANTMGTECFYEGQGRLDGASCDYTEEDKLNFLQKCFSLGIRNIEMEAPMFASITHHLGIKAADVCVTLLNRLKGDQVPLTKEQKESFEARPLIVVTRYVKTILNQIHSANM